MRSTLHKIGRVLNYVVIVAAVCIAVDFALLRATYPWHLRADNVHRYPFPYEMFRAEPSAADHNEQGFRGRLFTGEPTQAFTIAFYGGSTGYNGTPPIAETVEAELQRIWKHDVRVFNFSVTSSNHRQHIHGMVETLLGHQVDLVIFYGGNNEIFQTRYYDPRPGYPYNFFYREQTSAFNKTLLENSAFFSLLNKVLDGRNIDAGINLTPLVALRKQQGVWSEAWEQRVLDTYVDTLQIGKTLAETIPSAHCGRAQFMAFLQPLHYSNPADQRLVDKARARVKDIPHVTDVYDALAALGPDTFSDSVHVTQKARDILGQTIAAAIAESAVTTSRCNLAPNRYASPDL